MSTLTEPALIELGAPLLGAPETEALADVVRSGWLAMGDRVRRFEREFAALHGVQDAVAVGSATAALEVALAALGIGRGDEVLVPSLSFVATANVVVRSGATPVFVDIDAVDRPHMSIDDARSRVTVRTRAIVIMHYGGYGMDVPAWRRLADEFGLRLIEDAAHAAGLGHMVGSLSDAAAFSFFANKNMTTGEGGMILAPDDTVRARMRAIRAHGMTSGTTERTRSHALAYDVVEFGTNCRMDELRAAVGLVQLERLPAWNDARRALTGRYRELLAERLPTVTVPFDDGVRTVAHILPVLLPADVDRDQVRRRLADRRVQTSVHYTPIHHFTVYARRFGLLTLPLTEQFASAEMTVPLHPGLGEDQVRRVVDELVSAIDLQQ